LEDVEMSLRNKSSRINFQGPRKSAIENKPEADRAGRLVQARPGPLPQTRASGGPPGRSVGLHNEGLAGDWFSPFSHLLISPHTAPQAFFHRECYFSKVLYKMHRREELTVSTRVCDAIPAKIFGAGSRCNPVAIFRCSIRKCTRVLYPP
jgi:hypothetical protein